MEEEMELPRVGGGVPIFRGRWMRGVGEGKRECGGKRGVSGEGMKRCGGGELESSGWT